MLFGGETAQSYYEEGLTAAMKGDLDQAIRFFERAGELDAGLYSAKHQIGRCLLRQGKAKEAVPLLELAALKLPQLTAPRLDLGFALLHVDRVEDAQKMFSNVLQEKPDESRAVLGLAYCAFDKEQWETVMNLLMRAIESGRAQFDAHFLMARAADKVGLLEISTLHYQKAVALMGQSIDATPDQAAGYYLRAQAFAGMGHYTPAVEDLDIALNLVDPERRYLAYNEIFSRVDILVLKGLTLKNLGRLEEARQVGRKVLEASPENEAGKALAALTPQDAPKTGKGGV